MTIQFKAQWQAYEQNGVYTLSGAEEARLIGLGIAMPYVSPASPASGGGAVYYPSANTFGGVMDAIAKAQVDLAAGKTATVKFLPELYDLAGAGQGFPVLSGLTYEGSSYLAGSSGQLLGGTIIQGDGTFDIFSANTDDRVSPLTDKIAFISERIMCAHIRKLAILNGRNGIKVGAKYRSGAFLSSLEGLYIKACTGWGVHLENWGDSKVYGLDVFPEAGSTGAGFFAGSGTDNYNHGNMSLIHLFSQNGDYKTRGWCFHARGESGFSVLNDMNVFRLQRNASGVENGLRVAATMANASPNITVPDATAFPLDMPVTFTTAANGFSQWQTYFVVSSSGTTIQIADRMGGTPLNATGNTAVQLACFGRPALEIVGYGTNNTIQPSHFAGLDTEGNGGCMVLLQNSSTKTDIGTCFNGRGVSVASSLVARNSFGSVGSAGNVTTDFDSTCAYGLMADALRPDVSSGIKVNHLPLGTMRRSDGKIGINLWPSPGTQEGEVSLRGIGVSGTGHIYPEHAMSQKCWTSASASLNLFGVHLGCGAYVGTVNGVWNLPTLGGSAGGASNSWVGAVIELANASTTPGVTLTINTGANQPFDRQAGKTSVTFSAGRGFALRAQTNNGSDLFWQVISNNGVTI